MPLRPAPPRAPAPGASASGAAASPGAAGTLTLTGATASSVADDLPRFQPAKAIDGDLKTSWQEGKAAEKNQWIQVAFDPARADTLVVRNGNQASAAAFKGYRRLKDVLVTVGGGKAIAFRLKDTMKAQQIDLGGVAGATSVRITIVSTYAGQATPPPTRRRTMPASASSPCWASRAADDDARRGWSRDRRRAPGGGMSAFGAADRQGDRRRRRSAGRRARRRRRPGRSGALGGGLVAGGGSGGQATTGASLSIYPCPDSGPAIAQVGSGQKFLVTGKNGTRAGCGSTTRCRTAPRHG